MKSLNKLAMIVTAIIIVSNVLAGGIINSKNVVNSYVFQVFDNFDKDTSGTFVDERDNSVYKWVKINNQIWMAENLNYTIENGSWCYENDDSNCLKYGRLYDWSSANLACPDGWRLPWTEDFEELLNYVCADGSNAVVHLTANGNYGFNAIPVGYKSRKGNYRFSEIHTSGWWTAVKTIDINNELMKFYSVDEINDLADLLLYVSFASINFSQAHVSDAYSVRCIKNSQELNDTINQPKLKEKPDVRL